MISVAVIIEQLGGHTGCLVLGHEGKVTSCSAKLKNTHNCVSFNEICDNAVKYSKC